MSPATATLIGTGVVIAFNLLTAAFIYGQLTQKVRSLEARTAHLETTVTGRDGHGDRLTRLESTQQHHGD